jgi:hypothetical protein
MRAQLTFIVRKPLDSSCLTRQEAIFDSSKLLSLLSARGQKNLRTIEEQ